MLASITVLAIFFGLIAGGLHGWSSGVLDKEWQPARTGIALAMTALAVLAVLVGIHEITVHGYGLNDNVYGRSATFTAFIAWFFLLPAAAVYAITRLLVKAVEALRTNSLRPTRGG